MSNFRSRNFQFNPRALKYIALGLGSLTLIHNWDTVLAAGVGALIFVVAPTIALLPWHLIFLGLAIWLLAYALEGIIRRAREE